MTLLDNNKNNNLLATIAQVITITDGVAEYSSNETLDVLLPGEIAATLELSDLVTFTTSTEVNGTVISHKLCDRKKYKLKNVSYWLFKHFLKISSEKLIRL